MTAWVIDASVVAKVFFKEEAYSAQAVALVVGRTDLFAPEIIETEFANVVWKRVIRAGLESVEAGAMLGDLMRFPIQLEPLDEILPAALEIAIQTKRTVYDALYLATAIKHGVSMVTADERFANALRNTTFGHYVQWIGEVDPLA